LSEILELPFARFLIEIKPAWCPAWQLRDIIAATA